MVYITMQVSNFIINMLSTVSVDTEAISTKNFQNEVILSSFLALNFSSLELVLNFD